MKRRPTLAILAGLILAACSGGSGGYVGKWDSTFGGITLELKPDQTVAITSMGIQSEGTWEVTGKNEIVIHGPRENMTLSKNENGDLEAPLGGRFVKQK